MLKDAKIEGLDVLVIGTEQPWVEIVCLGLGAGSVTTVEYGKINSEHPKLKTTTPRELNQLYRNGELKEYDFAVSFSSLEHSGLGRYGDQINPWGDIVWTAKLSCLVKKGGRILVGVPNGGSDFVFYNAHRVYGPNRWPMLLQNWEAIDARPDGAVDHLMVLAVNKRPE